ncbi:phosphotransferase [Terrabacter sp. BE26]|uniref:phosphotransferase n=1 Tax=Terrabacter sp. BE26 TaxID=2898152 RepID=UPI0035BE7459
MTRSPLFLAALASSAVPGLDPVRVQGVPSRPGDLFETAYVQDGQDRRWVVKAPCTAAAGAMLDDVSALSGLLGRRIDVAIPMVRGYAAVPEGRAAVYLRLPGRPLQFSGLEPGPLAVEVGRTLAHIHNIELVIFEEAGRPTYDAEAHRRRQLSELDRAAATGHVPTGLLTRWEHALEDVSLWRFAPSAVHGTFTGDNVLASFEDEDDASTGRVRGVLAWEESRVGDPADDFAELASVARPATLDAVLEAYADSRIERPDVHLVRRARLAAELTPLRRLLRALSAGQPEVVESTAEQLRALEGRVEEQDRRHAREDARRAERAEQGRQRAAAEAEREQPGPASDEHSPEPDWDATQPHVPFPVLGATQAISTTSSVDGGPTAADAQPGPSTGPSTIPADGPGPGPRTGSTAWTTTDESATSSAADTPPEHRTGSTAGTATEEEPRPAEESQPVPLVAPGADASTFEIDEVEALPQGDAVLDLHEGASGFVPVGRPDDQEPGDHR